MKSKVFQGVAILLPLVGLTAGLAFPLPVPTGRFLIHIYEPWVYPPRDLGLGRTARATILVLKADHQYVEHSCYVIDAGKGGLYISPGDGHVVAVGTWTQQSRTLTARRRRVARTVRYAGPDLDPLCRPSIVEYYLVGRDGVRGEGGTVFKASNQLKVTDWDAYIAEAQSSGVSCGGQ